MSLSLVRLMPSPLTNRLLSLSQRQGKFSKSHVRAGAKASHLSTVPELRLSLVESFPRLVGQGRNVPMKVHDFRTIISTQRSQESRAGASQGGAWTDRAEGETK